jgi:hypothetical protein
VNFDALRDFRRAYSLARLECGRRKGMCASWANMRVNQRRDASVRRRPRPAVVLPAWGAGAGGFFGSTLIRASAAGPWSCVES